MQEIESLNDQELKIEFPKINLVNDCNEGAGETENLAAFLRERALYTWASINQLFLKEKNNFFPLDRISFSSAEINAHHQTKPTNIGLGMLSILAAEKIGQLESTEAERRIELMLESLKGLERFNGFFYDWYDAQSKKMLTHWPADNHQLDLFLSSVDNAWLALALLVVAQAKPALAELIYNEFLDHMDFDFFFDEAEQELFGGFSVSKDQYTEHHYPRHLLSEPRIIHWVKAALTKDKTERIKILKRLLNKEGMIPTKAAGGALFELLMPRLLIREEYLDHVLAEIFALHHQYGISNLDGLVGLSVADDPNNDDCYSEKGVGGTYPSDTVISSHGAVLALYINPNVAIRSLTNLETIPGFYDKFGYRDAVDVERKIPTQTQVFIDQVMVLLGLVNYQDDSFAQLFAKYFTDEEELALLLS